MAICSALLSPGGALVSFDRFRVSMVVLRDLRKILVLGQPVVGHPPQRAQRHFRCDRSMMFELILRFPDRLVDFRDKPFAKWREKDCPHRHERDDHGSHRLQPLRRTPAPNSLQPAHPSGLDLPTATAFPLLRSHPLPS